MIETTFFFVVTILVLLITWKLSKSSCRYESIKFLYAVMNILIGSNYLSIVLYGRPPTLFFDSLNVDSTLLR